jgi:hypothetical protein
MHAALLTVMFLAGAAGQTGADINYGCQTPQGQMAVGRDPQETCGIGSLFDYQIDWFKPMPQTCYSPRFGCYPGNGRDIQRYPAFHGTYYRRAYNYRTLMEYPWLAEPHEPVGFVSSCGNEVSPAGSHEVLPAPPPEAAAVRRQPPAARPRSGAAPPSPEAEKRVPRWLVSY